MRLRRATVDDVDGVAALYLRARHAAFPAIPRGVHPDEDAPRWVRDLLLPSTEVWVAEDDGGLVGMAALTATWVEQLYVDPLRQGAGVGARLLTLAKQRSSGTLDLWCFAANDRARRFYERHGFVAVDATDGDNEEGEPDVRYRWVRSQPVQEPVPRPVGGRVYETTRRVRLGDADRHGRLRLDALARLLQDVGNDDMADAGHDPSAPWIARRTSVRVTRWPRIGERVTFDTWCGGIGSHWAERRSSVDGGAIEVAALWVHVDPDSGRPARLPEWFLTTYGPAAGDRRIKARLGHGEPPTGARARPWPLRATDYDVLGHVNNAATWSAVEDELDRRGVLPVAAELEYRAAIEPGDVVSLVTAGDALWLVVDGDVRASAVWS